MVRDAHNVADLMQEIFLKMLTNLSKLAESLDKVHAEEEMSPEEQPPRRVSA